MSTDRELLEKAAKAAGLNLYAAWSEFGHFEGYRVDALNGDAWNPLTDDGDALRLAMALKLNILQGDFSVAVNDEDEVDEAALVRSDDVRAEVVRRAIVRAAAAIFESSTAKSREAAG